MSWILINSNHQALVTHVHNMWAQPSLNAMQPWVETDVLKLNEPPEPGSRATPWPGQSLPNYCAADTLISINFPGQDWLSKLEEINQ